MWKQWLAAIVLMLPLVAEDRSKQMLNASQTARFQVSAAGAIRLDNSFGEVDIDGWDRPEVEVTVVRSSEHYYNAQERSAAQRRMDSVQITTKQAGNDVVISTVYPPLNALLHPLSRRSDVEIRYSIHAPRASKLIVGQNRGGLNVSGLHGDIHATVVNGQITLALADAKYAIDAQCRVGAVYSDFDGRDQRRHAIGDEFSRQSEAPTANLYLRVRIGDIVILKQSALPTG